MSDRAWIAPIVERVVAQALANHASQLRDEIVREVTQQIASQPSAGTTSAADLARGISEIQAGSSQKEILHAMLDSASCFASRVALFVIKNSQATGWQARGFQNNEALKDFALDSSTPAVGRVLTDRIFTTVTSEELGERFFETLGAPAGAQGRLFPLILKDKVAALVYADAGTSGTPLDADSLGALVLATGAWLEVNVLRKQAHKDPSAVQTPASTATTAPAAAVFNDPFAAHAPAHAMAAAACSSSQTSVAVPETEGANFDHQVVGEAQTPAVEVQSAGVVAWAPSVDPASVSQGQTEVVPEGPPTASFTSTSEDEEVHRKAQRFARLLVEEIKLYNQSRVDEGRKNNDLHERLKDAIEKSRATYLKRYGNTVAASAHYFEDEVKRSLV